MPAVGNSAFAGARDVIAAEVRETMPVTEGLDSGWVRRFVCKDCCCLALNQYPPSPNMVRSKTEMRIIVNFLSHMGGFNKEWSS